MDIYIYTHFFSLWLTGAMKRRPSMSNSKHGEKEGNQNQSAMVCKIRPNEFALEVLLHLYTAC